MPMLTATDIADLLALANDAQPAHSLVLYRPSTGTTIAAQNVQVVYTAQRQERGTSTPGIDETRDDIAFYKAAPFDVKKGDQFEFDGHRGGVITAVFTDPVLGLIGASGSYDVARAG